MTTDRLVISLLLSLAGGCFTTPLLAGPQIAELGPETPQLNLDSFVEYLEDARGDFSVEQVQQAPLAGQFRRNDKPGSFNVGFTPSAYWYRLHLRGSDDGMSMRETWYLQVGFPLLDEVDVFLPTQASTWQQIRMGDQRPYTNRPIKHRNFVVPVELAVDRPTTLYLRVRTKSAHVVPLSISSAPALFKTVQLELVVLGCFYGIMLALILYNVFSYLAVRDRSYIDYIFFVLFCGVLLSLSLNGLGVEYFWSEYPRWVNASTPFHIGGTLFWLLAFTRSFLRTRQSFPRMNLLLVVLQCVCIAIAVLAFIVDYFVIIRVALLMGVVTALLAVFATARALIGGMQAARIYLAAWGVFSVFVILQIAQVSNLLPAHFITSYIVQIGTAAAVLLLSLALADRINLEREENEQLVKERQRAELDARAKSEFLAHMSHEIRTPMNAIIGFTDLAMRTDNETRRMGFLANIQMATQTLLSLLNNILDLSKLEAGKVLLERNEFSLSPVMEKLGALFSQLAAEKNIELTLSIPASLPQVVIGDAVRLEQVLVNLVGNALKFTEQGEVEIGVTEESASPGRSVLRFSVRDTGIGLTEAQCASLFTPFMQADQSTTRRYGGTGLGLSICKMLVEGMGGTITVDSMPGVGSTFSFVIPFDLPATGAARLASKTAVPDLLRDMRTLVVDDSATARKIHDVMLLSLGMLPESVASGEEAVRRFAQKPYQLVLIDWHMEGMDGLEAARQIRALPGGKGAQIIMITAHPADELSRRLPPGLVNATLSKPLTSSDLFDALVELFVAPHDAGRTLPGLNAATGAGKLAGAQILLVEDNLLNQRLAQEILRGMGIQVDTANDGREGVEAVTRKKYDAVLMDMQMPVMDGLEATRLIRSKAEHKYLPIIAITANVLPRDRDSCLDAGMNDFIAKPISPANLVQVLGRWLGTPQGMQASPMSPAPAMPAEMQDSADPINVAGALRRLNGNYQLFAELLDLFRMHHAGDLEKVLGALSAGDSRRAYQLVHTLKGVSANLTMPKLWAASVALQQVIEGGKEVSHEQRQSFAHAFTAALAAVEPALAEARSVTSRSATSG